MKDNYLNLFRKENYSPWRWPANWPSNIKHFFRCFKYAYQRAIKGYCDWDKWDLDLFYTYLFINSLRDYVDHAMGWPGNAEFPTPESWEAYIKEMAQHFENSLESSTDGKNPYDEDFQKMISQKGWFDNILSKTPEETQLKQNYIDAEHQLSDYREAERAKGFEMMQHVFGHLWD